MSGKGLSSAPFNSPPMIVQDADPLRFRVGEPDPKTREFAAFIGDHHHRYFAAAAAAAAAANPQPHLEFRQNFYSEKPISGNNNDSGGSDGEDDVEAEEEEDDEDDDDDVDGNEGGDGVNKDGGEESVSHEVVGQDNGAYYSQQFKTMESRFVSSRQEESSVAGENGCDFTCRRDPPQASSSSNNPMECLRTILSDPTTGALMADAMILPCGHTFGAGGIEQVKQMKACCTCSQPVSEDSITPNLTLRVAVQAFCREEKSLLNHSSKRKREGFDQMQERRSFGDSIQTSRSRNRSNHFPFAVADRVIIKGNKRTPPRFVGREAVVTTQCLNGWYVVKTLDNAESVKLQYRSLAKASEDSLAKATTTTTTPSKMVSNWL